MIQLKSDLFVSQTVSKQLSKQIDNHEQYSRRNCILIDGLNITQNETANDVEKAVQTFLKNEVRIDVKIIKEEFDKAHRIGKAKNGKQSTIVRLKSHSIIEKVFRQKKEVKKERF